MPYHNNYTTTHTGWNGTQHSISDYNVFYRYNSSPDYDSSSEYQEKNLEWLEYDQQVIAGDMKYERYSRCLFSNYPPNSASPSRTRYSLHPSSCLTIYNNSTPLEKRHSFGSSGDNISPIHRHHRQYSLNSCPEFSPNSTEQLYTNTLKVNSNPSMIHSNTLINNESSNHSTKNYLSSNNKEGMVPGKLLYQCLCNVVSKKNPTLKKRLPNFVY